MKPLKNIKYSIGDHIHNVLKPGIKQSFSHVLNVEGYNAVDLSKPFWRVVKVVGLGVHNSGAITHHILFGRHIKDKFEAR